MDHQIYEVVVNEEALKQMLADNREFEVHRVNFSFFTISKHCVKAREIDDDELFYLGEA